MRAMLYCAIVFLACVATGCAAIAGLGWFCASLCRAVVAVFL